MNRFSEQTKLKIFMGMIILTLIGFLFLSILIVYASQSDLVQSLLNEKEDHVNKILKELKL